MENDNVVEVFPGFEYLPSCGYSQLYHDWLSEIIANIDNVAELKVVLYVFRHTCGFHEEDKPKYITVDEFMYGRRRRDGTRLDFGTRLSEMSVRTACKKGTEHGFLVEEKDDSDLARIKKGYALKFREEEVQDLEPGVQTLYPGQQSLEVGDSKVRPRSEKNTPQKTSKKATLREILVTHSQKDLVERSIKFIAQKETVTYYELERFLHRYIQVRGKQPLSLIGHTECIIWTGVSSEFCEVIYELQKCTRISFQYCDESLYAKVRKPNVPIARTEEERQLPHWHPVSISWKK